MIPVECPNCGAKGVCMTVKIGDTDVWLDACYYCGTKLVENGEVLKVKKKKIKK